MKVEAQWLSRCTMFGPAAATLVKEQENQDLFETFRLPEAGIPLADLSGGAHIAAMRHDEFRLSCRCPSWAFPP
jgi:hypothetical protein